MNRGAHGSRTDLLPSLTRRRRSRPAALVLVALVAALGCAGARPPAAAPAPEPHSGLRTVAEGRTARTMVVAAHPEATRLGGEILRAGGTAIDAAITVQAALTLVEPQSSGLGGGALLLYFHAPTGKLLAFDGRETAPAGARPDLFLDEQGRPLPFPEAMVSGRAVGVPGVLRMLAAVHARHGRHPWRPLFTGAAELADRGFLVTPRLHALLRLDPILPTMAPARSLFYRADGSPLPVGARLANPALATTLRTIAEEGVEAFYRGPIAAAITQAVREARRPPLAPSPRRPPPGELGVVATGPATIAAGGSLTVDDLQRYQARERTPICRPYRRYRVCSFPPPSSGGIAVLQTLAHLERFDLRKLGPDSAVAAHLITEAERLAYADRDRWVADPDFVAVPTAGLLDPAYLEARGAAIHEGRTLGPAKAGTPPGSQARFVPARSPELPSTSHFVIVDGEGSVASMTTTIEFGFGSHLMSGGFVLNNQLTDFSLRPERDGKPVANAVAPGKRPRSSMAPVIVFDGQSGRPILALGSPGGARIIGYVVQALVGVLDWGLSPQRAVALPHVLNLNGKTEVEEQGWASSAARDQLTEELIRRGHEVEVMAESSGLHAVQLGPGGLVAGIDPRREGASAGE